MVAAHSPLRAAGAAPDGRQRDAAAALAPEHLAHLLELARALAGASEHAEIAVIAVERARALTGACAARIAGPRPGGALAVMAEAAEGAPARRRSGSASIPAREPEHDVLRGGGPLWLGSREEASERCSSEALEELTGGPDAAAWAFLPLGADRGEGGTLTLAFREAQPFAGPARAFLGEVAAACGSALARGELFTRERARANTSEKARAACELRQRRSEERLADRTHLYERERFARARAEAETVVAVHAADDLERVQPLTAALLVSDTARDAVAALAEHGPGAFGALGLDLTRPDVGGGSPARSEGGTAEAEVLREGVPLWLDAKELARRFPETSAAVLARHGGSWLGAPVPGDGSRRVLSLAFPRERAFTPGDRARLVRLATECASVLTRCAARDARRAARAARDAAAATPAGAFVVQHDEVGAGGPERRVLGVFSSEASAREASRAPDRKRPLVRASITSWTVDVAGPGTPVKIAPAR